MTSAHSHWYLFTLITIIQLVVAALLFRTTWPVFSVFILLGGILYLLDYAVQFRDRRQLMASSIAPLSMLLVPQLVSLGSVTNTTLLSYLVLLVLGTWYYFIFHSSKKLLFDYLWFAVAILLGCLIAIGSFVISPISTITTVLYYLPLFAVAEELVFRGLIQDGAHNSTHPVWVIIFSTIVYSLMFIPAGTHAVLIALLVGFVSSYIYHLHRNVFVNMVFNLTTKLAYIIVYMSLVH